MYEVILSNIGIETTIHYSTADKESPHLLKMDLKEKAGQTNQFDFTIFFNNIGYDKIFDLTTLIKIIKDEEEVIFEGRVFTSEVNMNSNGEFYKEVVAESEMAYLNDTRTRIWAIENMTVNTFINKIIDNHNLHTTTDKQFAAGNIQVAGRITCTTAYENSLNVLIDKMVNTLKVGYLVIRNVNGLRYLDYLPTINGASADINLGENMKDVVFTKDATNVATRIIPLGKDNLTIADVNGGLDYLENEIGILEFGVIEQTIDFKDIEDATALKTKGQEKLENASKGIYKLSTNVLDLSTIGLNSDGFFIGTDTNIKNPVIKFDEYFTIIAKDTDLLNPQNCKITLNDKFTTMTDRQVSLQRVAQYVEKILSADNQVNTFYLDGYINLLKNQMGAMADTAEKQLAKAILFEDKVIGSPSYGAMALGTQGFMIASNILNGDWDWRTFGTGKGFVADFIVAGKINAGLIQVGAITSLDGKVKIDIENGTGVSISGGALSVKNNNNTVIIDGAHNMFKIMVQNTVYIWRETSDISKTFTYAHGLGYKPAFTAFQQDPYTGGFTHLPAFSIGRGATSGDVNFNSIIRMRIDENYVYIDWITNAGVPITNANVTYFLYKEVAF